MARILVSVTDKAFRKRDNEAETNRDSKNLQHRLEHNNHVISKEIVINMLGTGVLVWVGRQVGSVYRAPAAWQTAVPVTAGNYEGARHSNKNKRDGTKMHRKYRERRLMLRNRRAIPYIATQVLRMWVQ